MVDLNNSSFNAKELFEQFTKSLNNLDTESEQSKKDFDKYKISNIGTFNSVNASGRNVQEIFGLSGDTNKFSHNCIRHIQVDHDDYMDMVDTSAIMQNTIEEGEALLPTFKYLHEDIFLSLYLYNPEILPPEQMHIQSYMNRSIIENLINTPEYIYLRKNCKYDMFNAGVATEILGQKAIELLTEQINNMKDFYKKAEALDKLMQKEEEMDALAERLDEIDELIEQKKFEHAPQDEIDALNAELQQGKEELQNLREYAGQMAEDCDELVNADGSDKLGEAVAIRMVDDINDANAEVQQVSQYVEAWGLGSGHDVKVPFDMKRSVLEKIRNSPNLREFTDLIGKYKEAALVEQKRKSKEVSIELESIKTGKDFQDALPSEKINLCNNVTKKDFERKMTENQLLTYDKESHYQKHKGPIIICIDESGSMQGDKEVWAKALAVGILEIAQRQKREFACIPYDSHVRRVVEIAKDEINPQKIIDIAEEKASGGTDFERPLREASKLIDKSNFKQADIVFITDGDCGVSDSFIREFKKLKDDKDFKTMGVLVDYGHSSCATLNDICDSVTTISKIADAKNANSEVNKMIFGSL